MTNRYYILPLPNDHSKIWSLVVEKSTTVRKNLLHNKMIIKLYKSDEAIHPIFKGIKEYTHAEILQYLEDNKETWINNNLHF
jgi:hypothetical protein